MRFRIEALTLKCRQSTEVIAFQNQITFFYGQTSSGKSTILRLIDFCLGGTLEVTPALASEAVYATLACSIGNHEVALRRDIGTNQISVAWNDGRQSFSVLAPIQAAAGAEPILGDDVYNFSDLLFHLTGSSPIRVRRSSLEPDSPMVRLSFRDVFWYCYLDQDHIDSSFFWLGEDDNQFKRVKSRYVMRYLTGYYTERLGHLESELAETKQSRSGSLLAAQQVRSFLKRFGYDSERDLIEEIEKVREAGSAAEEKLRNLRDGYAPGSHFADHLRDELRAVASDLSEHETAVEDLARIISEHEALVSELKSAKFKLARAAAATKILKNAQFVTCPQCGSDVKEHAAPDLCPLCGSGANVQTIDQDVLNRDLDQRIEELEDALKRHRASRGRVIRDLQLLRERKLRLDSQLTEELRNYDSAFLSSFRAAERECAELQERMRNLDQLRQMPKAIEELEQAADELLGKLAIIGRSIEAEKAGLDRADENVAALENTYLEGLLSVRVPGVNDGDQVSVNRTSWLASVLPSGKSTLRWHFYQAGSNGRKTLLKVIYCLALHQVAEERGFPLPSIVLIDYPMKNIGDDTNRDLFESFYRHLFKLAGGALVKTQFILVDNDLIQPEPGVSFGSRFMTRDDPSAPPLISYYRGEIG